MFAVRLKRITKRFAQTLANDAVDINVRRETIHAIIGENGAGKTTIMEILYGFYQADAGEIELFGEKIEITNPQDAIRNGIGMVHQHFMLIPPMTVAENIILGMEPVSRSGVLQLAQAEEKIKKLSDEYGLEIDPQIKVENLSVGIQQRVEILKALYRDAEILILDEPTAVLTPLEVKEFFQILLRLKEQGKTIIIITHKLEEVLEISDDVSVMRNGKLVGELPTSEATANILANMMVGRDVLFELSKTSVTLGKQVLKVEDLCVMVDDKSRLKNISFELKEGEILGIAGVEGNGQTELVEVLTGLRKLDSGTVWYLGEDIANLSARKIREHRIAHIPADRKAHGFLTSYSNAENQILGFHYRPPFCRKNGFLNFANIKENAEKLLSKFDIRPPLPDISTGTLSGGNQQKVIVARELSQQPRLLIIAQPTRGIDIGAIEFIHQQILDLRSEKVAVLLVSAELEEIRSLSDRTLVMFEGEIAGEVNTDTFDMEKVGMMMTGHH
ncbi:MAG: ABC transporter ATP-binding protein [Deltaproteobacteria bacterium]|nr:ABC transporter ATP-binding protein [Deltaproteobacteria bacterium]MBT4638083.1 ABC transporter ATP-binding protein [Deltaproteobacteria bacterium]MBT6503426.1 ABC transporter ATP-binding protein [Deltaproteobacteria bacterium]MBT6611408.1 ABC transporter ATP-binding protein [Deltaproteobacteria bacterium]MBT7155128.1 ABC transporter ATP-binding protein [Deltaproteobacteria bacterium]